MVDPVNTQMTEDLELVSDEVSEIENSEGVANENQEDGRVVFDEKQQAVFNKAISKKTRSQREAERQTEALRKELDQVKAQLPKAGRPEIPSMPETFDDTFQSKMSVRDKALSDAAMWDFRQEQETKNREHQAMLVEKEKEETFRKLDAKYNGRAKALGISPEVLAKSAKIILDVGISDTVAEHILNDDQGPAIVHFLALNPTELDEFHALSPMKAAAYIEQQVKPRLSNNKISKAPNPISTMNRMRASPNDLGPPGATYE